MIDLKQIVDKEFSKLKLGDVFDTDAIVQEFEEMLGNTDDASLIETLIICGYIPDLYEADSSKETLFTKLCEVIEVIWARRMGFQARALTQKSGYEDVEITINDKIIVSDTKSFRLSRSQPAPNVKDFVKPEDYRTWLNRKEESRRLGGLVIYPQLHEWSRLSNAYKYCSDKSNPIVMLPFHYLAYLLKSKNDLRYDTDKLVQLWDFESIFNQEFEDRIGYWKIINNKIISITGDSLDNLKNFLSESEKKMHEFVLHQRKLISQAIIHKQNEISTEIHSIDERELKEEFIKYRLEKETEILNVLIDRISRFRIDGDNTNYMKFIEHEFNEL